MADISANKMTPEVLLDPEVAIVLHWSGRSKPFASVSIMEAELAKPYDDMWSRIEAEGGLPPLDTVIDRTFRTQEDTTNVSRAVLYTDPRSGSEWFMELLDETPDVCATGATGNPTAAFPREAFIPSHYHDVEKRIPACTLKRGCLWGFVVTTLPLYVQYHDEWCSEPPPPWVDDGSDHAEMHSVHGQALCLWSAHLLATRPHRTNYTDVEGVQILWNEYEHEVFLPKSDFVPCSTSCQRKSSRMFKFMRIWGMPRMN
jgi:hypothetical protein